MGKSKAFLCYSRRDRAWVEVFYDHLLALVSDSVDLFWDNQIESGSEWNKLLEREVTAASSMVLIATPEALASPDVQKERDLFVQKNKNQRIHYVRRVPVEQPAAWGSIQWVDCTDEPQYRRTLQQLAAKLREIPTTAVEIRNPVVNPHWQTPTRLPPALWTKLVKLVHDALGEGRPRDLGSLTHFLELPRHWETPFPTLAEQANAAVVKFLAESEPFAAAARLLDALDGKQITPERHDLYTQLGALRRDLEAARHQPKTAPPANPTLPASPPSADPFAAHLVRYRQAMLSQCNTIEFFGFESAVQIPIRLEQLWVPLEIVAHEHGKEQPFDNAAEAARGLRGENATLPQALRHARARDQRGLVILGDPGSGKTTLLRRTVCEVIDDPAAFGLASDTTPVLLRMRQLESFDPDAGLDQSCRRELPKHAGLPADFGSHLYQRRLLVLVDGLDEVPEAQRPAVSKWLTECLHQRDDFTFVVTSRYAGYTKEVRFGEHFLELHLRPFRDAQWQQFVTKWYDAVECSLHPDTGPTRATEAAGDLLERLKTATAASNRMREMAANPLLLTNLCLVHRSRSHYLPEARHRLYDECLNVLFEHWRAARGIRSDLGKRALQPLALCMHERGEAITEGQVLEVPLGEGLRDTGITEPPAAFLRRVRDDSGVLTGWSGHRFGFLHLGFQEYLAAREIARRTVAAAVRGDSSHSELRALATKFGEPWWREVILLLLAHDEQMVAPWFEELLRQPALDLSKDPNLFGDCVRQAASKDPAPFVRLVEQALDGSAPAPRPSLAAAVQALRILAPKELARLAPRLPKDLDAGLIEAKVVAGAVLVHGMQLLPIPSGAFWMGDDRGGRDERPRHRVTVPAFHLAATPVTNDQYRRFVEATGATAPESWNDRKFNAGDQPVVTVSWEDAEKFCQWAGLALPREAQWEYACRAGTETQYWSGDAEEDLARVGWYDKNSGDRTHAVGEKPANAFGLHDMHGNILEWCADRWHANYQGAPHDGSVWEQGKDSDRVVRGGSWFSNARWCRSAYRGGGHPSVRDWGVGFRPARFTPA